MIPNVAAHGWRPPPQGEYIAPEKVENVYVCCKFIAQSFLYGDSLKSCCVAIVVPDEEVLLPWARENGYEGDFSELCQNQVGMGYGVVWGI